MRLVYLGTPAAAVPPLRALVDDGHDVRLVVTRADAKRGRGGALVPSPVKVAATELEIAVTDRVDDVLDAGADLGVVVAFGRIIRPHVLARLPMVNVHFSLLPRWRGAAPVERAILAGDAETGVCIMAVEEGLDTGGVYARQTIAIGPDESAAELRDRLVDAGTRLLLGVLRRPSLGDPEPQRGEPTYAEKIDPSELRIDWSRRADDVVRLVRVGGAWTTWQGRRVKVHRARTSADPDGVAVPAADGDVWLVTVQPEGKAEMPARAWANGARFRAGDRLGT